MGDDITIRPARRGDDEAALAEIAAVVQQLHFAARPDIFKPVDPSALEAWFRSALKRPRPGITLAQLSGAAVGYAISIDAGREDSAFAHPRRWREVDQLAVLPGYRRRGVARALIADAAASARAAGFPALELNTWAFNEVARTTFRRLGFIERNMRHELVVDRQVAASPNPD